MTLRFISAGEGEKRRDGGSSGVLSVLSSVRLGILGVLNVIFADITEAQSFLELFVERSTVLKERNSNENNQKDLLDIFHEVSNVIFMKGSWEVFEHLIF